MRSFARSRRTVTKVSAPAACLDSGSKVEQLLLAVLVALALLTLASAISTSEGGKRQEDARQKCKKSDNKQKPKKKQNGHLDAQNLQSQVFA